MQLLGASAATVAGLGLVGCGGSSSSSDSSSDSKVATIKERGKLKAGVKKDVVGYGLLNTSTNTYEGMEIDLCYQVAAKIFDVSYDEAKSQGLVEFTDVTPKTRGPLIDNDQLDIICATYTITDERKQSWDFTDPYRTDHIGILIKKGSMSTMADLDGKHIGVSQGSTTKDAITKMLADQGISAKVIDHRIGSRSPSNISFPSSYLNERVARAKRKPGRPDWPRAAGAGRPHRRRGAQRMP